MVQVINQALREAPDDSVDKRRLLEALERDGLRVENGAVIYSAGPTSLRHLTDASARLQLDHLPEYIERLGAQLDDDPAAAIGGAKDLLESALKTILDERGLFYDKSAEIPELWSAVRKELNLVPDSVTQAAKGGDAIRRTLGSLGAIVAAIAELRNLYGTGHGRSGKHRGLGARHGRLVVGATAALVTFLAETHHERTKPQS